MRIFCPYCSAEHAVDVNQIPLVGMDFHCPQCRRSFRVTADGEVEATDEDGATAVDLPGAGTPADPFAAFVDDLDLTAELDLTTATDEELLAATLGGREAPPPLPLPGGGDEEDEGARTTVVPAAELLAPAVQRAPIAAPAKGPAVAPAKAQAPAAPAKAPIAPPAPSPAAAPTKAPIAPPAKAPTKAAAPTQAAAPRQAAAPAAAARPAPRPVAPQPVAFEEPGFDESGLSEQDLVLIGSYHKTSESLSHGADVVWKEGEGPGDAPQPPPGPAAAPRAAAAPQQPPPAASRPAPQGPAPTGVRAEAAPPPAARPTPQEATLSQAGVLDEAIEASLDLESPFEITSVSESPFERAQAGGGVSSDDWPLDDLGLDAQPFAAAPAGGTRSGGAGGGGLPDPDALFDLGPVTTGPPGAGVSADPDALFDLDLEIGSPRGGRAGAARPAPRSGALGPDASTLATSQPLLEEMDFSSLLQEEDGGGGDDSIFELEPSGVFQGAAVAPGGDRGRKAAAGPAAGPAGAQQPAAAAFAEDALFDLELSADLPTHMNRAAGPPPTELEQSLGAESSFKPAKVPQKRARGAGKGLQFALFGVLLVVAVGLGLGQIPDVGYFGVNLLFPPDKPAPPPAPVVKVSTDMTALTADTVAAYLDQIQRLEKALELHPDDEGAKKALAEVLDKFSLRYPGEFEHNKKFQRRLEELTKELGYGDMGLAAAREKLRAGDPEAAKAELAKLLQQRAGGADFALTAGQIEMQAGNYDKAIPQFQTVLELQPDSIEARYLLGRSLQLVGRLPDAVAAYQAVLAKSPEHDSAKIGLAELKLEMGQAQEALELAGGILEDARARKLTEQTFAAHRLLARVHGQLNQPEKEKEHLEEALSIKPHDETLLLQMAGYLKARGQIEEATQSLAECWEAGCDSGDYYSALGELYLEGGDSERALEVLQTGLKKYGADVPLLMMQGRVLRKRGEVVAARESYQKAIDADPTNTNPYDELGDLFLSTERYDDGVALLKVGIEKSTRPEPLMARLAEAYDAKGRRTEAQQILGDLVDRDPLNFPARLKLAVLLKRAGLVAEALAHFDFLYKNNQMQREVRIEYADALREARRYDQAERELRQVLQIDPNDLVAKVLLGAVLVEEGHFDEADGYLREVIAKDPRHGMAFYYLGKLELARDKPDKALEFLGQASRSADPKPEYRFAYAETLMRVGGQRNLQKADSAYTGLITADETGAGGGFERMTDVYLHRGQVRMELHLYDKALADFEKAMALNPLRADTVTAFASGLIKKKRFGDAERYLETVIKENPNFAPAHYQLALVFNARHKLADAKRHFLKAIMEDETAFPEALRFLGYIFREQRLDREAKRYFKRYLELAAEDAPERPEIERLLGKR